MFFVCVIFKVGYTFINTILVWEQFSSYEAFLIVAMVWLIFGNAYFLHNATENFQLNELKLSALAFLIYLLYSTV